VGRGTAEVTAVTDPEGGTVVRRVTGERFFASCDDLAGRFDYAGDPDRLIVGLSAAHVWDASSVAALDAVETKDAQRGKSVEITGLNEPSARIHETLGGELTGSH
jgi:SulP family sulfate permease